ncbi:MAG TPA: FAD-dependent oxidoreductase, partial [Acetobacteraceae bacterium]|nr:FAD-dependent oxidoreductase [Acetobacteraceae bacterium]
MSVPDVLVVGGGCAGLFAAIAARLQGLDCLVLEVEPRLGGGTAISSGLLWVGNNPLQPPGDSPEAVRAYLSYVAAGAANAARMEAFARTAPEAVRTFQNAGIPFRVSPRLDHYGMAPGARSGRRILDTPPVDAAILGDWSERVAVPAGRLHRLGASELVTLGGANSPAAWDAAAVLERTRPTQRGSGAGLMVWLVA